ncbi:mate-domain-containing protein [Syncephalastrum racemosum]|uniref:Mate-domain-containing protein n=1 Tax=Syncephalastrum racemosum TaxID=13706 RepID=A0A1X2H9F8_SYNRA|nr:mate-domain-containing protein [Syncephalastrum racemosum]
MSKDIRRRYLPEEEEATPLLARIKSEHEADFLLAGNDFWWFVRHSIPIAGSHLLVQAGGNSLAAAAVGNMVVVITSQSFAIGITSALDTLCSQAWTGSTDKGLTGLYLQRASAILFALCAVISVFWWSAGPFLEWMGQEHAVAQGAETYLRYTLIGQMCLMGFEALKRYLQAQGATQAAPAVLCVVTPIHLYLSIQLAGAYGLIGACVATCLGSMVMLSLLGVYTHIARREGWSGWSCQALRGWSPFLKRFAGPGMLASCSQMWVAELPILFASTLHMEDPVLLAAHGVLIRLFATVHSSAFGMGTAAAARMGNLMGKGYTQRARRMCYQGLWLVTCLGLLVAVLIAVFRRRLAYGFTDTDAIAEAIMGVLPLQAFILSLAVVESYVQGALRGIGRQQISGWLSVACYDGIAIPIAYVMGAHYHQGIIGIWAAYGAAKSVLAVGQLFYLVCIVDWEDEGRRIHALLQQEEQEHE